MIDMHQGFSGRELADTPPSWATVALQQLEVATAVTRGQLKRAAQGQLTTARLAGELLLHGLRARFKK
jgi:hypothetical protein